MVPPKASPKKARWRKRLDWKVLVISRSTLYTWIGIISLLLLVAVFLAFFSRGLSMANRAKQAIASAEKSLNSAYQAGAEIFSYVKYSQAAQELSKAKKSFDAGDYRTAYDHAIRAEFLARRAEIKLAEQGFATARFATVVALSGKAEIKRPKELSWQPASPGVRLSTDDQIRTFSDSQVQIAFDDATILRVKPNSLIIMGSLSEDVNTRTKKSSVRLMASDIEAKIKKSSTKASEFKIEMPTAVARVEKADLAVKVSPGNESQIRVFSGTADISSGGKVIKVRTSQEVRVTKDSQIISSPLPLAAAPTLIAPTGMKQFTFPNPQQGKVTMAWTEAPGARAYHLEVAQDQFFFDPMLDLKPLTAVLYEAEKLEAGVYFWRVSGLNGQGSEGSFSDQEVFQIKYSAEGAPLRIESLLVLVGREGNTLYLQGTTGQSASLYINKMTTPTDAEGRFRVTFKKIPAGRFPLNIRVISKKGNSTAFQKEIPVGI